MPIRASPTYPPTFSLTLPDIIARNNRQGALPGRYLHCIWPLHAFAVYAPCSKNLFSIFLQLIFAHYGLLYATVRMEVPISPTRSILEHYYYYYYYYYSLLLSTTTTTTTTTTTLYYYYSLLLLLLPLPLSCYYSPKQITLRLLLTLHLASRLILRTSSNLMEKQMYTQRQAFQPDTRRMVLQYAN
jgi:hypothetical protein